MDNLRSRIDGKKDDLVNLTRDLVRIPTTNPPGDCYRDITDYLEKRLAARGVECRQYRATGSPGDTDRYPRYNLVAEVSGKRPGPVVHFNSHIDVVPPGIGWTRDPYGAEVEGDLIYGRGTCDMKGGLAASIIAVEALLEEQGELAGSIQISATADEESGGYGGVAWLADQGILTNKTVDHVIIPEPLNKDRVCLGHRGVWWAEIETLGKVAHGSMPFLGDCAIRHMHAVVDRFEQELFPALKQKQTDMPVVPDGAKESTLNINSMHGGLAEGFEGLPAPMVPDSCRMVIDRRFLIEESLPEVKQEVNQILEALSNSREGFRYNIKDLFEVIPTMADRNAAVVREVAAAVESTLGQPAEFVVSPGTYDQKHFDRIGHIHNCIAYGPGILDLAHQVDEYVSIQDMLDSAVVMATATHQLLSGGDS